MRQLFIVLSLFFFFNCRAQTVLTNESLVPDSPDIFYIGVDNYIKIKSDIPDPYFVIYIKGGGGMIIKVAAYNYIIRVEKKDSCIVAVYDNRKRKSLLVKNYTTDFIPAGFATLNGLTDTTASKNRIRLNSSLRIVLPNCYYKHDYQVSSFDAILINNSDSIKTNASGYQLTKEQLNLINELTTGDKILFDNIRVTSSNARITRVPSFWIRIE
jgi:hypothetical protein